MVSTMSDGWKFEQVNVYEKHVKLKCNHIMTVSEE